MKNKTKTKKQNKQDDKKKSKRNKTRPPLASSYVSSTRKTEAKSPYLTLKFSINILTQYLFSTMLVFS